MAKILFLDRWGELNYADVTFAYVSCCDASTRLVCGSCIGWDMPRQEAEALVRRIASAKSDDLIDLTGLGKTQ